MKAIEINRLTVGEIVALDFRAAAIFREYGIDFCCGGKKSIKESCSEKSIDEFQINEKLSKLKENPNSSVTNYIEWEPGFLCDYIVNTHHKYVLKTLPELVYYTSKISDVHGDRHPELIEVSALFLQINNELLQHLKNEEEVLFPAVKEYMVKGSVKARETILSEISRLSEEHEFAGGAMDKINVITNGYKVPADGCNTYQVAFRLLKEFEDDLHIHVHLENNVLFPKLLKS
jgi:regulator of cell morphogenesis and NO signaling